MRGNHVKKTPRYRGSLLALNKQGMSYCFMGGKRAVTDARLAEFVVVLDCYFVHILNEIV